MGIKSNADYHSLDAESGTNIESVKERRIRNTVKEDETRPRSNVIKFSITSFTSGTYC
jgi:hypothetical protein